MQQLLHSAADNPDPSRDFIHTFNTKKSTPSAELVASLMELSLMLSMPERAVEFFVWGRENDQLPPVDSLLNLLAAIRYFVDWRVVRRRLYQDLENFYPKYVSHKYKVSELTGRVVSFLAPPPSASSEDPTSAEKPHRKPPTPIAKPDVKPMVDWVDFVSNPTQFSANSLTADSLLKSNVVRRDQIRQDTLQKHFGVAIGDRQRKLRQDVKTWTPEKLQQNLDDNVMLTCVVEELVVRGLEKEAVSLLKAEVASKRYLISTEPFLSLATYFKEKRNVKGVLGLLQTMMEQQLAPDIYLINIMLELHVSVGNLTEANDLWNRIYQFNVVPNSTTIGIVISLLVAAVETQLRLKLTLSQVLRTAHKHGVELSDASFTPLLKYCIVVRNYQFAQSVFPKLKSPNYAAYSHILEVYLRTHQLNKFIDVYNTLESHFGRQIDLKVISMAREALFQLQRPHSFVPLLRTQILKHGFQPTVKDFQSWICSSLHAGQSLLGLQLDVLRSEICPQVSLTRSYVDIIMSQEMIQELQPPITTMEQLRDWYATTPNALTLKASTGDFLRTAEIIAWNLLIKTWIDVNLPRLRAKDVAEFTRIQAEALEARSVQQAKRQKTIESGKKTLLAMRQKLNARKSELARIRSTQTFGRTAPSAFRAGSPKL